MKRGFLLPSPKKSRHSTTACPRPTALTTSTLPQSTSSGDDASNQQRRRLVTKSSDLLELETDGHKSSEILRVVQTEPFSDEQDCIATSDDFCHDPDGRDLLLDDWVLSSSSRPLLVPSSSTRKPSSSREENAVKYARPLILEVVDSTVPDQRRNGGPACKVGSNQSDDARFDLNRRSPCKVKWNDAELSGHNAERCELPVVSDCPSRNTPQKQQQCKFHESDSLLFANELSLLLSRLRRCAKFNNKRRIHHKDVEFEAVFNGMYMSQEAEVQVKEFASKHFLTCHQGAENTPSAQVQHGTRSEPALIIHTKLVELWSNILGPIAQDYSANSSSTRQLKNKNRSTSSWASPSLAVGLGILAFSNQSAIVFDSLESTLLDGINPNRNSSQVAENNNNNNTIEKIEEIENKQKKISALGAISLLRCWIRYIGVKLSQWEVRQESSLTGDKSQINEVMIDVLDFYSKIKILLLKILPPLERIVSSDTRRTVLALAAMDACFELVEISARITVLLQICQGSAPSSTPSLGDFEQLEVSECLFMWRDILSIIDKLLDVKQGWISINNNLDNMNNSEKRDDHDSLVSRSKCLKVVLDDWKEVCKMSKRYYFDYIVGEKRFSDKVRLYDGAKLAAGLTLMWNLAGIKVHKPRIHEDNSSATEEFTSRVGGIAQSLCQTQECTIGCATGSCYDCGGDADVADLVLTIEEAIQMTCEPPSSSEARASIFWTVEIHQRLAIRALASWLSKNRRNYRGLLKTSKDHPQLIEKIIGVILSCLRLKSKPCVDMSLAVLSMVWDLSPEWHPRETRAGDSQSFRRFFLELLDALRMHSAESFTEANSDQNVDAQLDSTTAALCVIVSRVVSENPEHLLPVLEEFSGPKEVMLEVVIDILEQLPTSTLVQKSALRVLLDSVDNVPYARAIVQVSQACFCQMPCNLIVPAILDYLAKKYSEKSSSCGVVTVSILLRNVMIAKANEDNSNEFVKCVLDYFQRNDPPPVVGGQYKTGVVTTFIQKNVSLWRSVLLDNTTSSDSAYSNMIMAASRAVIESPSSSTPLSLLSKLVRIEEEDSSQTDTTKKMFIATSRVLVFLTDKVSESRSASHSTSETNIFTSIAPLLILRCIPRFFYRTLHEGVLVEGNIRTVMVTLSTHLVESIKVQAQKNEKSDLAREERRLVAEVAGHCLPLSNRSTKELYVEGDKSFSLFDSICKDSFYAVLHILRKESQLSKEKMMCRLVESKSALYAVCHHLSSAEDKEEGSALLDVACFAMEVLQYDATAENDKGNCEEIILEEIAMLQSGCINFLAVVFDSLSLRKTRNSVPSCQNTMVEEVNVSVSCNASGDQHGCSIVEALSRIFDHVKTVIISSFSYNFGEEMLTKLEQFSPSSRTAMLNSLVILCRTGHGQNGKLEWIAQNILPPLVKWANSGPTDDSVRHPLCVAAGLQVVYTLLARVGSFDWIHSPGTSERARDCAETGFACLTLKCALNSFETAERNNSTIMTTLRLAALKLMLTVMAIHKTSDSTVDYLKPLEMQKAIKAVTFAANFDEHPDVRRLASDVVPRLHHVKV